MHTRHILIGLTALAAISGAQAADREYQIYLHTLDSGHTILTNQTAQAGLPRGDMGTAAYLTYLHTLDASTAIPGEPAVRQGDATIPALREHRPASNDVMPSAQIQ